VNIKGKTALVTGANRGLGSAFAQALLDAGAAKVYAGARDPRMVKDPRMSRRPQLLAATWTSTSTIHLDSRPLQDFGDQSAAGTAERPKEELEH
jgi:NAD(P)-dependent dehydrogenase (short-subunit alcohol dehydrogenase family)